MCNTSTSCLLQCPTRRAPLTPHVKPTGPHLTIRNMFLLSLCLSDGGLSPTAKLPYRAYSYSPRTYSSYTYSEDCYCKKLQSISVNCNMNQARIVYLLPPVEGM
eukprot:GHVQ01037378.1.p1 GENE.GHVQ01037378.1~~GHVQ01037378.1.p1  ORF type:complete len:104 (+),score=10.61 GHVQ01037378.1:534-845(+)